jgi:hypothetical protein
LLEISGSWDIKKPTTGQIHLKQVGADEDLTTGIGFSAIRPPIRGVVPFMKVENPQREARRYGGINIYEDSMDRGAVELPP